MTGNVVTETPTTEALLAEVEDQIQFHHISLEKLMIARSVILDTTRKLTKKAGKEASATLSLGAPAEAPAKREKKRRRDAGEPAKRGKENWSQRVLAYVRENGPVKAKVMLDMGWPKSPVWSALHWHVKHGAVIKDEAENTYSGAPASQSPPPEIPVKPNGHSAAAAH